MIAIKTIAGQKILGSARDSICRVGLPDEVTNVKIGNTIKEKAHAARDTAPHLSITGAGILDRSTVSEPIR
jgi:hypothetical protein